jgi:glycosyltransferase involved in cell wall biosynthesis
MKRISIVVSAYNEADNIPELIDEIWQNVPQAFHYELIVVNDGSTDETEKTVRQFCKKDSRIKLLNFTRNYGHEIAMTAGMDLAAGDAVIFMDADLQHPPSLLPVLIQKWEAGSRIVLSKRTGNAEKTFFYKLLSALYYRVLNYLSEFNMHSNTPDFRLVDRHYIEILKSFRESSRLFRGLLYLIDAQDDTSTVEFVAPKRHSGNTKYNFPKLADLAIDSILAFSIKPLRIALLFSITLFVLSVLFGLYFFIDWFINGNDAPGFMTLLLTILILGSSILFVLSVIGEYIGRIHLESKNRPLYTVKSLVNFNE